MTRYQNKLCYVGVSNKFMSDLESSYLTLSSEQNNKYQQRDTHQDIIQYHKTLTRRFVILIILSDGICSIYTESTDTQTLLFL